MAATPVVQERSMGLSALRADKFMTATFAPVVNVTLLNGLAAGNTASTRVGRQVRWVSIELNLFHSPTTYQMLRVVLLVDTAPNGALASVNDIFSSILVTALYLPQARSRFVVLSDNIVGLNSPILATSRIPTFHRVLLQDACSEFSTIYNSSPADTVAAIATNALLLVVLASSSTGVAAVPAGVTGAYELTFVDH